MAAETKERILDVAERLFADFGYKATSLRDITSEAGVNLASVNYHFGSKDALLAALLNRRFAPVNRRRLELLDELENSTDGAADLSDLVQAFLSPPFEMYPGGTEDGRTFLRLVGRIHSETDDVRAVFVTLFQPIISRFTAALQRALPHLDADEVAWRIHFLVGSMAHTMMWCESFLSQAKRDPDPSDMLASLIQFGTAGLEAPSRQPVAVHAHTGGRR
mgnify:FL=1